MLDLFLSMTQLRENLQKYKAYRHSPSKREPPMVGDKAGDSELGKKGMDNR
ncbi:hypothetical protein AM1_0956 [Acaryochloris marina MBIC11017]|uniref:Uncharacterized protein n=1 Tax=Acaryochloris marina (strain MBIC 11017) TaxID=329726 RepID=B0BZS2_ACAM1|nr:hypothetical protein AM1_0956 [Acaryochloris marina MBIC11017]